MAVPARGGGVRGGAVISAFNFIVEGVECIARAVSLSLRLFGNM